MSATEPSPAELARLLNLIREDVKDMARTHREESALLSSIAAGMATLRAELDARRREHDADMRAVRGEISAVRDDAGVKINNVRGDVEELQDWQRWAARIVLGLVLAAVVGLALAGANL